ncbi:MAG: DUF3343 domain-containing protein [Anaerolineaceae bacterium]|nr:DUF3343 domain-containing protein [Anaerolineaceae bacterium]
MSDEYTVVLVHSTNHAIHIEGVLKSMGVGCKLIPTPRALSSDCGVCVRISRADAEAARLAVKVAKFEIAGIHDL